MIVLGHMVLPALTIPLTFLMLPNKRLDEDLENDGGKFLRSEGGGGGDAAPDDPEGEVGKLIDRESVPEKETALAERTDAYGSVR